MEITQEMRQEVLERSGRRCECLSEKCRHHRKGSRCPKGLRGNEWKIYYRTEAAGANLWNLEAWCLTCFKNNYG
jgi:hypothetical protein